MAKVMSTCLLPVLHHTRIVGQCAMPHLQRAHARFAAETMPSGTGTCGRSPGRNGCGVAMRCRLFPVHGISQKDGSLVERVLLDNK